MQIWKPSSKQPDLYWSDRSESSAEQGTCWAASDGSLASHLRKEKKEKNTKKQKTTLHRTNLSFDIQKQFFVDNDCWLWHWGRHNSGGRRRGA
jgi:hypothetical protein